MSLTLFIILILITTFLSAIFSAFETALVSCDLIRFKARTKDKKSRLYNLILGYLEKIDDSISRILVLNNIVNSIFATIITLFITNNFGEKYLSVGIIASTFFLFIFGEMMPKLFSILLRDKILIFTSILSYPFMRIIRPISNLFHHISIFFISIFSKEKKEETELSEADVKSMVKNAVREGNLEGDTEELIKRAFEFDDKRIIDIMQKWDNVAKLTYSDSPEITYKNLKNQDYTRLPVVNENGQILGIYNIKSFFQNYLIYGSSLDLESVMFPPFFINAEEKIDNSLKLLSKNKVHMAFVVEQNENICGIVTIEDILEELVGEIRDEEE